MRILYITDSTKPYSFGGVEEVVHNEAIYMKKKGHKVYCISIDGESNGRRFRNDPFDKRYLLKNDFYWMKSNYTKSNLYYIFNNFAFITYKKINKIIRIIKPEIIHLHYIRGMGIGAFLAAKEYTKNVLYTSHDYSFICPKGGLLNRNGELCQSPKMICKFWAKLYGMFLPNYIVAVSSYMKDLIAKSLNKYRNIELIYNGIELPLKNEFENKNRKIILFVGRVELNKGVDLLIRAFKKISYRESELWIVGEGSQKESLLKASSDDRRIKYFGRVDKDKLSLFYRNASIVCIPSISPESFCLVAAEAMSYGLPIIASNIGALSELIENKKNGLLVEPKDEEELRIKLEELLSCRVNTLREISENNISKSKNFSWDLHGQALERIYDKLFIRDKGVVERK